MGKRPFLPFLDGLVGRPDESVEVPAFEARGDVHFGVLCRLLGGGDGKAVENVERNARSPLFR